MKKLTAEDPETRSAAVLAGNIEQLQDLFPEAFAEGGIDFDVLKQLLGGAVEEREEKYGLNWYGKRRARQLALTPSNGTLRPCPEDSVDWDTTQNLMIEGDNLEVLKLLQKSYSGRVKVIYIDPPYNTGRDFIYPDKYEDNLSTYLRYTGQVNDDGFRISSNTEASGRFHTNWLNMMYPRLKLARNLLRDDGVVFVSIDDNEESNLRQLLSDVFGGENFVGCITWEKTYTPKSNGRVLSTDHDYILVYCRSARFFESGWNLLQRTAEQEGRFSNADGDPKGPWRTYPLDVRTEDDEKREKYRYEVVTPSGRRVRPSPGRHWSLPKDHFDEEVAAGRIYFGKNNNAMPTKKVYLSEARQGVLARTWWPYKEVGGNQDAKQELLDLFGADPGFLTPKPVSVIKRILELAASADCIVLDFFAGSGTSGHAVLDLNSQDSGQRRFILVQLPEPTERTDYPTIADITKERLRRCGQRLRQGSPMFAGDLGFRVFKLDSSNIRAWDPDRQNLPKSLLESVDHLKTDRTETDILYELLLKLGLDLCVPMEKKKISGKDVYGIGGGVLLACLAGKITREQVEPLAEGIVNWHKALAPAGDTTCVFRDSAFADDVAKTNWT
jgi:adenine-specific DNA-methyltransferase